VTASDGATDAQVREALRGAGVKVGSRGRLSDEQYAEYDRLTAPADNFRLSADAGGDDWPTADLDDAPPAPTVAFDPGPGAPADEPGPLLEEEQAPRHVRTGPTAGERARRLWDRRPRADAPAPKREQKKRAGGSRGSRRRPAEHPWRPTAGVIETIWTRVAMSAGGIPPVQRILAAQAPMSGIVLEQQLRGTLADRMILQPAARVEAQAEAVTALFGVPVLTAWVAFRGRYQLAEGPDGKMYPVITPDGMPVWTPGTEATVTALKYCLMSWLAVTERHGDEIIAQAEATVRKGKDADDIIRWIFSPASPGQSWDDVQKEAAERAAGFTAPPTAPGEPAQARYHEGPPPSTAFLPALTGSVLPR
jgi:hypothetical protein